MEVTRNEMGVRQAVTEAREAVDDLRGVRAMVVTDDAVTLASTVDGTLTPGTYTSPGGISVPCVLVTVPLLGQVALLRAEQVGDALDQLRTLTLSAALSVPTEADLTGRAAGTYIVIRTGQRVAWDGTQVTERGGLSLNTGVNAFPVPVGSTGAATRYTIIPERAALRVGVYESGENDDQLGFFRGRVPADAANVGIGSVSLGRENLTYGYLGTGVGHSNSAYGVASLAGGAGSATGNPDDPDSTNPARRGYCAIAFGKNVWAYGSKSSAFGEHSTAFGRASLAAGYYSQAGDEDGTDLASVAIGYRVRSDGQFTGAGGSAIGANIWARNGSHVIGYGEAEGSPYVTPVGKTVWVSVLRGKPVVSGVIQPDGVTVWNGYGTDAPSARHDFRIKQGEAINILLEAGGGSVGRIHLQGLDNDNQPVTLGAIEFSHENGGSPVSRLRFYTANGGELPVLPQLAVGSDGSLEVQAGVRAGGSGLTVNGTRVVGGQLPAIPHVNPAGNAAENATAINRILAALEAHGLIAT